MPDRDALALHVIHAQGGRVEQQVHQMVVEQVDLVDVEHAAVRRGEQAGLEGGRARGQHALDVERTGQAVLGRPHRQFGQRDRAELSRHGAVRACRAGRVGCGGIAGIRTAGDHGHRRQQRGQPADHGRLRGALLAADQDTPDGRRHRIEQQRQLQVRHPDDASERVGTVGIPGGRHHRAKSFPGFLARSPELAAAGVSGSRAKYGDLAGHPRSQLRDSPGFAPEFLRVAASAQHGIPADLMGARVGRGPRVGRGGARTEVGRGPRWGEDRGGARTRWGEDRGRARARVGRGPADCVRLPAGYTGPGLPRAVRCQPFTRKLSAGPGSVCERSPVEPDGESSRLRAGGHCVPRARDLARNDMSHTF